MRITGVNLIRLILIWVFYKFNIAFYNLQSDFNRKLDINIFMHILYCGFEQQSGLKSPIMMIHDCFGRVPNGCSISIFDIIFY